MTTVAQPNSNDSQSQHGGGDARDALSRYRTQLEANAADAAALEKRDRQFGVARLLLFVLALAFFVLGYGFDGVPGAGPIGWLLLGAFLVVVVGNEPVRDRLAEKRRDRKVIRRLIGRLERDWDELSNPRVDRVLAEMELSDRRRELAADLDLFGRASLFQLVSLAATTPGIRAVANWLTGPAIADTARQRQRAADALAELRQQRLRFYTLAREVGDSVGDPDRFTQWATGPSWLERHRPLVWWADGSAIAVAIFLIGLIGSLTGLLPADWLRWSLFGLGALTALNLLLTGVLMGPAHEIFSIAMSNRHAVDNYQELFAAADWIPVTEEGLLAELRDAMVGHQDSASQGMRDLRKVATAGGLRQSAATFLLYLPLQAWVLWDVRVLKRLEAWQNRYRDQVGRWFDALGQLEALLSISALRDDYPSWTAATWQAADQPPQFRAESIGHPLLADHQRVSNDVVIGPPQTLLLVTGSNMSGKSTMLRSVGLNAVLAGAGAPVCASSLSLPSLELATSIRVSDDLAAGVSFYMAELKRLKSVVDQAREMAEVKDCCCLFLLDEILQGTNSRERQIAVVHVLKHLMHSQSIGAISTHDLELADDAELLSIAQTVHFRETIRPDQSGGEQMTFDYKMHQGVSPTTNALRLLEMVGLGKAESTEG